MNHPTEEKEEEEAEVAAVDNNAEENGEGEGIKPHHKNGSS